MVGRIIRSGLSPWWMAGGPVARLPAVAGPLGPCGWASTSPEDPSPTPIQRVRRLRSPQLGIGGDLRLGPRSGARAAGGRRRCRARLAARLGLQRPTDPPPEGRGHGGDAADAYGEAPPLGR